MRGKEKIAGATGGRGASAAIVLALLVLSLVLSPSAAAAAGATYVVQPGDTLSLIAATYGVTVEAIMQANGLTSADYVRLGQRLTIPTSGDDPSPSTGVYVVKAGDSIGSIAWALGISQTALLSTNNLSDPNLIRVGQRLLIPGAPDPGTLPGAPDGMRYTVRAGDSLSGIAVRYGTTAEAIAQANGLINLNLIYVGLELKIPSPEGPAVNASGQALRFVVSISQQRCWLYRDALIIADWPCSTGQYGAGTNAGTYTIQSKLDVAYGSTWNIWMPYWLGIYWAGGSENGIHGIPYDADTGWRLWEGYVGTPVTFGCVLLDDVNAKRLYDLAYIGMPVIVRP